jgi:superfamily II DNA or RNA helicase
VRAILDSGLTIEEPGGYRPALKRLATFRRRGRVPTGERRIVPFYHAAGQRLILPRGLLARVRSQAPVEVVDRRLLFAPIAFRWRGSLFGYQQAAVEAVYRQQGGVLVSPPGSGKTVMGVALAAAWGQPTLWLTHTLRLQRQAYDQARRLLDLPPSAFGLIGQWGTNVGTHFTVAMVQTLAKRPDIVRQLRIRVGTVIQDEAHHVPSWTWSRILTRFPAAYRLGLSATPDRTDGLGPLMVAIMGGRVIVPLRVLIEAGRVMAPKVRVVPTGHSQAPAPWADMERVRAHDPRRNALIVELVAKLFREDRRCLVLVTRKDHARILAKALVREGVQAFAVMGELTPQRRERYLALMERGQAVCVATRLADEGLDVPSLDALVLASAARSRVQLEQQIGRVMRQVVGKPTPYVFDLADDETPTYRRHVRHRLALYRHLGLEVRVLRLT